MDSRLQEDVQHAVNRSNREGRRMRVVCEVCGETFDPEKLIVPEEVAELGDDAERFCTVDCRDAAD